MSPSTDTSFHQLWEKKFTFGVDPEETTTNLLFPRLILTKVRRKMQRAELFEHPVRCLNMILRGQGNDIVNISPVSTLAKSFEVQRSEVHAKDVSCLAVRESGPCFKITYCSCLRNAFGAYELST